MYAGYIYYSGELAAAASPATCYVFIGDATAGIIPPAAIPVQFRANDGEPPFSAYYMPRLYRTTVTGDLVVVKIQKVTSSEYVVLAARKYAAGMVMDVSDFTQNRTKTRPCAGVTAHPLPAPESAEIIADAYRFADELRSQTREECRSLLKRAREEYDAASAEVAHAHKSAIRYNAFVQRRMEFDLDHALWNDDK